LQTPITPPPSTTMLFDRYHYRKLNLAGFSVFIEHAIS